jgi:hypothetical protein
VVTHQNRFSTFWEPQLCIEPSYLIFLTTMIIYIFENHGQRTCRVSVCISDNCPTLLGTRDNEWINWTIRLFGKAQVFLQIFVRVICREKYWVLEKGKSSHRSCQSCASPPGTNRIDPDPIICPFNCEVLSHLVYCSYIGHITPIVKTMKIYSILNHASGEVIHKSISHSWWPSPWIYNLG